MTTAILTENYCLDSVVTATQSVTLHMDFVRQIYARGGVGEDEPHKDKLLDYRPDRAFRTRKMAPVARVVFDFQSAKAVRLLAILAHNLTPAGGFWLELSNADDFSSVLDERLLIPTAGQINEVLVLPAEVAARYLRVTALDMTRDWLEIGVVIAGNPTVLSRGVAVGAVDGWRDPTIQARIPGGGMAVTARPSFREPLVPFDFVTTAAKEEFFQVLADDVGRKVPILIMRDWTTDSVPYTGWWIYGLIAEDHSHRATHPTYWGIALKITELIGRPSAGVMTTNLQVTLSTTLIAFDDTQVGATSEETFSVTNDASSVGTLAGLVSVTGTGFTLVGSQSYSLLPGASATFTVRFAPTTTGSKVGSVSVTHNGFNAANPATVSLSGVATAPPVYSTWNAAGTNPNITLSNGNLTAEVTGSTAGTAYGASAVGSSFDTGKRYLEIEIDAIAGSAAGISIGFSDTDQTLGADLGDAAYGYAWRADGYKENNGSASALGSSASAGDIIMLAIEGLGDSGGQATANIWFGKNGTWFGSGDPATGANPAFSAAAAPIATDFGVRATLKTTGDRLIANFGASAFAYSVPAGFGAGWGQNIT